MDAARALQGFAKDLEARASSGRRRASSQPPSRRSCEARAEAGSLDEVTAWLSEREGRLLAALAADLGDERVAQIEAEVEAGLERWRAADARARRGARCAASRWRAGCSKPTGCRA